MDQELSSRVGLHLLLVSSAILKDDLEGARGLLESNALDTLFDGRHDEELDVTTTCCRHALLALASHPPRRSLALTLLERAQMAWESPPPVHSPTTRRHAREWRSVASLLDGPTVARSARHVSRPRDDLTGARPST